MVPARDGAWSSWIDQRTRETLSTPRMTKLSSKCRSPARDRVVSPPDMVKGDAGRQANIVESNHECDSYDERQNPACEADEK
jgi:hypothetical protein